jgi:Flp pilus assembly protein TadG
MCRRSSPRRSGTTLPETALVLGAFLLFLMGVFEYSRFIMLLHVGTNAARSGARYASVNVSQASNFDTVANGSLVSIHDFVKAEMGGAYEMIDSRSLAVFPCDNANLYADPPVIVTKAGSPAWNQATFGERIAVRINGNYKPILPGFVFFYTGGSTVVPLNIAAAANSEG